MPVPPGISIMGQSAHLCKQISLSFDNPRGSEKRKQLTRTFHVYLEIGMQSKHDALMRGYCDAKAISKRKSYGTQVQHDRGATAVSVLKPGGFYGQKALTAAGIANDQIINRWNQTQIEGQSVFTRGIRVDAMVQSKTQLDNYQYEISYWYEVQDIYVLFHCYPPRQK